MKTETFKKPFNSQKQLRESFISKLNKLKHPLRFNLKVSPLKGI